MSAQTKIIENNHLFVIEMYPNALLRKKNIVVCSFPIKKLLILLKFIEI